MCFGSGEILHGRSKRIWRKQANIHLHASAKPEAHFVFTARDNFHQAGKFDHVLDQLFALAVIAARRAGHQDVEIPHGFAPPAKRTGRCNFFDSWIILKVLGNFSALIFRSV